MNRREYATACLAAMLCAACAPGTTRPVPAAFDRTLERDGVRFRVRSANDGSLNRVRIDVDGRLGRHTELDERAGLVTEVAVGDLDGDGFPELYVMTTSAGSGSYGELSGLGLRAGGGLERIALVDPADSPALRGYQGHDRFELRERMLLRRFPLYRPEDPNARPGGGVRELRYRLSPPRAGQTRSLQLDGHVDLPVPR